MTKKQKKKKRYLYWGVILLLFVVAMVVVYMVWDGCFREKKSDEVDIVDITTNQVQNNIQESESQKVEEAPEKQKVVQYDGKDPNTLKELSGVVTYVGVSGQVLMIRVNIDQYLVTGECQLELRRGGVTIYNGVANIVQSASTATCEGFDVPVAEIGEGGVEILINLSSNDKNGVIRGEVSL